MEEDVVGGGGGVGVGVGGGDTFGRRDVLLDVLPTVV